MTSYANLNDEERKYVISNPVNSYVINEYKNIAVKETEQKFGYNGHNDETDAFRHCVWSGLIAKRVSHQESMKFTTLHEAGARNSYAEKSMDLHNNKIGADIGQNAGSEKAVIDECYKQLKQGNLKYY
jgi:hypothetical protein